MPENQWKNEGEKMKDETNSIHIGTRPEAVGSFEHLGFGLAGLRVLPGEWPEVGLGR